MPIFVNLKRYPRLEPDHCGVLREKGTAISATTAETAIALNPRTLDEFAAVVISNTYTSFSAGSAFWQVSIESCPTSSGTFTAIGGPLTIDGTAAIVPIPISGHLAEYRDSNSLFVRARAIKTGSPGNLDYAVLLTPD
jgi:hypothetical protein